MKKVLCIAEACCDMIFGGLPGIPRPGQEVYCREFEIKAGGGANTPMGIGRMKVPVRFLTRLGEDWMGQAVHEELRQSNVEIAGSGMVRGDRTAVSAVLSTCTDRCFASYQGSGGSFFTREQLEQEIREADIVHTYLGYCLHAPIAELCSTYGKELSLDTSFCDTDIWEQAQTVLAQCSYFKLNREEALALTGTSQIREAAAKLSEIIKKAVIITLGKEGSITMSERQLYTQPAVCIGEFKDACGAGDSYAAGFLSGIAMGMSVAEAMKLGAVTSGYCVTWYGGMDRRFAEEKIWESFRKV